MKTTNEHIGIMRHTRDRAAGGFYCGDSPAMQELVQAGFMECAGRKSFVPDPYFKLTHAGRLALRTCEAEQPRPKPVKRRRSEQFDAWMQYCEACGKIAFGKFIAEIWPRRHAFL